MVILRATSILGGQKEDNEMMCSITHSGEHHLQPSQVSSRNHQIEEIWWPQPPNSKYLVATTTKFEIFGGWD
jgi:hypothetical protein